MITALQNFISKRGRPLFFFLLIIIGVSFVLYLSQGNSSVFDFFPDPNQQKKVFYGIDLNDPEKRRGLNITNKVAADLGAVISPTREVLQKADAQYFENLQNQLRAAYQPENRDKVDQEALQNMFGYMQSWRNFPDSVKVMAIARSGDYDYEFSESSIRAKLIMDHLANELGFLALDINHPGINSIYHDFLNQMNPMLSEDENRSIAFQNIGRFRGVAPKDVDNVLFDHFRAHQVDRIFAGAGFSLDSEAEIELHNDQFAWDADAVFITMDDFEYQNPAFASITFKSLPENGDVIKIDNGKKQSIFVFHNSNKEANGTKYFVQITKELSSTVKALASEIKTAKTGFKVKLSGEELSLVLEENTQSGKIPKFETDSQNIQIHDHLTDPIKSFFEEVKTDEVFVEPARTFASVVSFDSDQYYSPLPEPDEARMKSYFERNKELFEPLPVVPSEDSAEVEAGAKGPTGPAGIAESNSTVVDQNKTTVTYEKKKEEVRNRIIEIDKLDAQREADELAKEAALAFLDSINSFGERMRSKFTNYQEIRSSNEMKNLLQSSGAKIKKVSFAKRDMAVKSRVLGLQSRESERRSNRDPLMEVDALNDRLFFTRSIRKTNNGYAIFILDRKTKEKPGNFESSDFSSIYSEFIAKERANAFGEWLDQQFEKLSAGKLDLEKVKFLSVKAKSPQAVRASYDRKSSKIQSEIRSLQDERNGISDAERESNATKEQLSRKSFLDSEIKTLRDKQADLNSERTLSNRLMEVIGTTDPSGDWIEQERTEESALFIRLNQVYTLRAKKADSELVKQRARDLEFSRSENARSLLLGNLVAKGLSQ